MPHEMLLMTSSAKEDNDRIDLYNRNRVLFKNKVLEDKSSDKMDRINGFDDSIPTLSMYGLSEDNIGEIEKKYQEYLDVRNGETPSNSLIQMNSEYFVLDRRIVFIQKSIEIIEGIVYIVSTMFILKTRFYRAFGEIEKNFILDPYTYMARYKYITA